MGIVINVMQNVTSGGQNCGGFKMEAITCNTTNDLCQRCVNNLGVDSKTCPIVNQLNNMQ